MFTFSMAVNILMLAMSIYTLEVFDRVLSSRSTDTLIMLTILIVFAMGVLGAFSYIRARLMVRLGEKVDLMFCDQLMAATVRRAAISNASRYASPLRDLNAMRMFFAGAEIINALDIPWLPIYMAVIYMFDPLLGAIAITGAFVLAFLAVVNEMLTRSLVKEVGKSQGVAMGRVEATVRNAEAVEAMGMLAAARRRYHRDQSESLLVQRQANDRSNAVLAVSKAMRLILQVAITAAGAVQALNGSITGGAMIVAGLLMARALAPIEGAISTWKNLIGAHQALKRLDDVLRFAPPLVPPMAMPAPTGRLKVDRVAFAPYGTNKAIIKGISFDLAPGESLGIVGKSAAGKTTLGKLLVGIWKPQGGAVRLDGVEMATWFPDERGRHVGYLPQEIELFTGTIRENIARLGDGDGEQVIAAAKLAGVHEMILQFPDAYETRVGDGGLVLSGGQRQRLGLARAFYGMPRLIVLDEPNSNLDSEGEGALVEALAGLKKAGCTVIVIAHRTNILANIDKMMVLQDGAIAEFGARGDVMQRIAAPPRPRIVAKES